MLISKQLNPALCCSKDKLRESLQNIFIDKENNCLLSTDGFIGGIYACEFEENDVPNSKKLIPAGFFEDAVKMQKKSRLNDNVIELKETEVVCEVAGTTKRADYKEPQGKSAELIRETLENIKNNKEISLRIAINPSLLLTLAKSLDAKTVILEFHGKNEGITVYPNDFDRDKLSYGVIMPFPVFE